MKLLVMFALILATALSVNAQVPSQDGPAMLIGPMYDGENWSVKWGGAKQVSAGGHVWLSVFGDLGTTAQFGGELTALFSPVVDWWSIGPVAGIGADWSDEPGMSGLDYASYITHTAGLATTVAVSKKLGLWAFGKYTGGFGENAYKDGWIGGGGVWLRLSLRDK